MRTRITESSWGHMACDHHAPIHIQILIIVFQKYGDILVLIKFENNWMVRLREHSCHAPNLILGFVTTTDMLISSLNLILTRTNLTFTKAFIFLFILVSLLKWFNFPLDIQSIYIVPQRITQSTDYSNSKFYIMHLLIL